MEGKRAASHRDKIERIVQATRSLAEAGGREALRARQICEKAGVSTGALYRHFESVEHILLFAFTRDFESVEQQLARTIIPGDTQVERVENFFRSVTNVMEQQPAYSGAVISAMSSGQQKAVQQIVVLSGRITNLVYGAIMGEPVQAGPDAVAGRNGTPEQQRAARCATILYRYWFSMLVGWSASAYTTAEVIQQTVETAQFLLEDRA